MTHNRREFLRAGALGAAGTAVTCGGSRGAVAERASSPFSIVIQFSGLLLHGSWPAKDQSKPNELSGWDVLLINDGKHKPGLRIPLVNVRNPIKRTDAPHGYVDDRLYPGMGVWDLTNVDVLIAIDGDTSGHVTTITGKRPTDNTGAPVACPNPQKVDEYLDITWLADMEKLPGKGRIKDELKGNAGTIKRDDLLSGRVRLSSGSIACAPPSNPEYEGLKFGFSQTQYQEQFHADLVRFTSASARKLVLQFVEFSGTGPVASLEIIPVRGAQTVTAFVEHHDPKMMDMALAGKLNQSNFWEYHFEPYYKVLKDPVFESDPLPNCCVEGCDPPFYCFMPRAYLS